MTEKLREVLRLVREKKYNDALDVIDELEEKGPIPPFLLVQKGRLIQLAENNTYSILDAENAFKKALGMVEDYVEALNELGKLYYSILGKPDKAMPLFERAFETCRSQMATSLTGLANCTFELEGKDKALEIVKNALAAPMDMDEIAALKREIMANGNDKNQ